MTPQGLQKILELAYVGCFTVQQLLAEGADLTILPVVLVNIFQPPDHIVCVVLDQ